MGATVCSDGEDEGENAAKPITATKAMMRRLAYAIGIRGLTCLRGSRQHFQPDECIRYACPKGVDGAFSARFHRRSWDQGIGGCRVEQPLSWQDLPVVVSVYMIHRYLSHMKTFVLAVGFVAVSTLSIFGSVGPVSAEERSCAERFPEADWVELREGSGPIDAAGVRIESTGVAPKLGERFNREIMLVAGWISDDIGPFSATVCLVSTDSTFEVGRYESGSFRFHAHSDLPGRLLVLNVQRVGFVGPAGAYALAQHALWQGNGEKPFPEPIASVVGQWYRARFLDRLEQYHRDVMFGNFFDTEAFVEWTSSSQDPIQDWDPENNFAPIGDFMEFAVANYGTGVLLETDGERWSEIEGEWRVALRNDLRGRDTDTTGWIGGVALTAASILIALVAITLGLISKHRRTVRKATPAPIPGFFSET